MGGGELPELLKDVAEQPLQAAGGAFACLGAILAAKQIYDQVLTCRPGSLTGYQLTVRAVPQEPTDDVGRNPNRAD